MDSNFRVPREIGIDISTATYCFQLLYCRLLFSLCVMLQNIMYDLKKRRKNKIKAEN